ncbi:MAG: hypothetical protein CMJ81_08825 [Planctomycetaceae bacterium]|jgi:hypothetical protein|nr:hypothetical protein [Planctomycetaceae bacterium]
MKLLPAALLIGIVGCGLRGHRPVGQDADAVAALEELGVDFHWNSRGELADGYLRLDGTRITDAGLVHLRGLTNLQWLGLRYTKVTPAGIARLKKELPHCQVHHELKKTTTDRSLQ